MFNFITIPQGERAVIWSRDGRARYVDGPRRMFLTTQRASMLRRHSAAADEYLVERFKDGRVRNTRGPAAVWGDPVEHAEVSVAKALPIDANEAIVVYSRDNGDVRRRVVRGPAQFVPSADEWLHDFRWHGADPRNPTRKIPRALQFQKLRVIPDQSYVDVESVRTADDALIIVRLMVFFELVDIERMLDQTHDPIADFVNAVTADAIDFAGGRLFEQFKAETDKLNDLLTYPNLTGRSERIGYRVNKVVYRGYEASDKLQSMHDSAIEKRTGLKLESETERQAQELADLKLEREARREDTRRRMEREKADHVRTIAQAEHAEKLRQQRLEAEQQASNRRLESEQQALGQRLINEVELEHIQAKDRQRMQRLEQLRTMNVDMTRYLVSRYQHPDRLIRIDGGSGEQLHLHERT